MLGSLRGIRKQPIARHLGGGFGGIGATEIERDAWAAHELDRLAPGQRPQVGKRQGRKRALHLQQQVVDDEESGVRRVRVLWLEAHCAAVAPASVCGLVERARCVPCHSDRHWACVHLAVDQSAVDGAAHAVNVHRVGLLLRLCGTPAGKQRARARHSTNPQTRRCSAELHAREETRHGRQRWTVRPTPISDETVVAGRQWRTQLAEREACCRCRRPLTLARGRRPFTRSHGDLPGRSSSYERTGHRAGFWHRRCLCRVRAARCAGAILGSASSGAGSSRRCARPRDGNGSTASECSNRRRVLRGRHVTMSGA
jgi:hypothetical protein